MLKTAHCHSGRKCRESFPELVEGESAFCLVPSLRTVKAHGLFARPLIEPSFDVLQNEKAAKGLAHMHALEAFCKEYGESENFSLNFPDNPCNITVIRAGVGMVS